MPSYFNKLSKVIADKSCVELFLFNKDNSLIVQRTTYGQCTFGLAKSFNFFKDWKFMNQNYIFWTSLLYLLFRLLIYSARKFMNFIQPKSQILLQVLIFWEGHKNWTNFHLTFVLCCNVEISQHFVAFSEYMKFNKRRPLVHRSLSKLLWSYLFHSISLVEKWKCKWAEMVAQGPAFSLWR